MYIKQKLLIGLCIFFAVLGLINLVPKKASADIPASDILTATFTFRDGSSIIGDFGASGTVRFIDSNATDSTRNYKPTSGDFCDPGDMDDQPGISGDIKYGINIVDADLQSQKVTAHIKLGFNRGVTCQGLLMVRAIENPGARAATDFRWSGADIVSLDGQENSYTFILAEGVDSKTLYISHDDSSCGADGAILLDEKDGNTGIYFRLNTAGGRGGPENLDDYPRLASTGAFEKDKCRVASSTKITIAGTKGAGVDSDATQNVGNSCEINLNSPLSWIICPVLRAAEGFASTLYDEIQGLLSFRIPRDIQSKNGENNVRAAWSIFRTIVTVAVVILMLVMVFSQAIGSGPFEPYTVRKLLPRIAIGVILIQLSWPLFAFVVNLVDDIGNGLADLLYAPFGGKDAVSLYAILDKYNLGGEAKAFTFTAMVGGVIGVLVAPFLLLSVMLSVVIAILVAIATLIFREIIILLCLVTAPIAIMLWMMPNPGIRKYWDLWSDNLIKALLMFPIIVLLIAAGQIFAWVAGGSNPSLISFLIVIVGFFGPLFLLPKAYTWGGSLMRTSGDLINRGGAKLGEAPKRQLQAQHEAWRAQKEAEAGGRWSRGEQRSVGGILRGDYFRAGQWTKPFIRGKSANAIRTRQLATLKAKGAALETEEARQEEEEFRSAQTDIANRVQNWSSDKQLENLEELYNRSDTTNSQRRAILGHMLQQGEGGFKTALGHWNDAMESGTDEEISLMNKFKDDNYQTLFPAIPQIYKAGTFDVDKDIGSTVSGLKAETMGGLRVTGVESILSTLDTTAAIKDEEGKIIQPERRGRLDMDGKAGTYEKEQGDYARKELSSLISVYHEAMSNPNTAGNLAHDVNKSMLGAARQIIDKPGKYTAEIVAQANDVVARVSAQTGSIRGVSAGPPPDAGGGSTGGWPSPLPTGSSPSGAGGGITSSGARSGNPGVIAGGTPASPDLSRTGPGVTPGGVAAKATSTTAQDSGGAPLTADTIAEAVASGMRKADEIQYQRSRERLNSGVNAGGSDESVLDVRHDESGTPYYSPRPKPPEEPPENQ